MKRHGNRGAKGENDFKGLFKTSQLMRSSLETTVFGGVALRMPAWIRAKDKSMGAGEKNCNSSLLVRTSGQRVTTVLFVCDSTAFHTHPNVFSPLFLNNVAFQ